jgi:hypothetical protein
MCKYLEKFENGVIHILIEICFDSKSQQTITKIKTIKEDGYVDCENMELITDENGVIFDKIVNDYIENGFKTTTKEEFDKYKCDN